jgi:hypothetical protein
MREGDEYDRRGGDIGLQLVRQQSNRQLIRLQPQAGDLHADEFEGTAFAVVKQRRNGD